MRGLYWIIEWALNAIKRILTQGAELGAMRPQAKGHWQPPRADRGREQVLPPPPQSLWREHGPVDVLIPAQ